MIIRFDVARSRSYYWNEFLRRARHTGRHRVVKEAGVELHLVEVDGVDAALEIWHCTRSWNGVSYRVDGQPLPASRFNKIMHDALFRETRVSDMLRGIVEKKAREREARRRDDRWRSGLGPDPELGY